METRIRRLRKWPTVVQYLRCYLCGGGSPDQAEVPCSLHDDDYGRGTGRSLLQQRLWLPRPTGDYCVGQRTAIRVLLLEAPRFVSEN